MPTMHEANPDASDFDKLLAALGPLGQMTSIQGILEVFGLADMPAAQRYGIMFGCVVFFATMASVLGLLVLGGTFRRIDEQAKSSSAPLPTSVQAREGRPLMLERLLKARERMLTKYAKGETTIEGSATRLTEMLLNVAPEGEVAAGDVPGLIDEESRGPKKSALVKLVSGGGTGKKAVERTGPEDEKRKADIRRHIPDGYEENYVIAYRKCQERPGGSALSGLPDARFEAYARAYAGCGTRTSPAYRRSYARLYEAQACRTHASEREHRDLFVARPRDLVGRHARLEALDAERHAEAVHEATSGDAFLEEKPYDPREVWGFLDCGGPFRTADDLRKSPVFRRRRNEAAFAVVSSATDTVLGVVILTRDDPRNLSIRMEAPILHPARDGSPEQAEACFLLLDRLFALGYRRVQLDVDSHDEVGKKIPGRLGFTREGTIPKHMIVRDANRDSNVYGLINTDWAKGGARTALFKKLYGLKTYQADEANNKKEAEYDEWQTALEKQRVAEATSQTDKKKA